MDDKNLFDGGIQGEDVNKEDVEYDNLDIKETSPDFRYIGEDECVINDGIETLNLEDTHKNDKKKEKATTRGFLSKLLYGVMGIAVGMFLTIFALPSTSFFKKTPIYKALNKNNNTSISNIATGTSIPIDTISKDGTKNKFSTEYIVQNVQTSVVQVTTKAPNTTTLGTGNRITGLGTGFIINEEGQILTNFHVISDVIEEGEVNVVLQDGSEDGKVVQAKIVNFNQEYDLALLEIIDKNIEIPAIAKLGDSDQVNVGQDVIAIGNPLSQDLYGTVTKGIISAKDRAINDASTSIGSKVEYLQTDAAINSGNSGGPLFNMLGEVIGINAEKATDDVSSGTSTEGIGFAIPINTAKEILEQLTQQNLLLGIQGISVDDKTNSQYNLKLNVTKGFYVDSVTNGSPADISGMKSGDVIVKFDGKVVESLETINEVKYKHKAGDIVEVVVDRNGKNISLNLTLRERE